MPEMGCPYWIVSTHLGHTVVYGRFATIAEAINGAEERMKVTGQVHELVKVKLHEQGMIPGSGEEVWTVMLIDKHDVVCGKYVSEDVAMREAAVCMSRSRAKHSLLVVKVLHC